MNGADLILNLAYVLLIGGGLTRNILWLRTMLLLAAFGFITYGLVQDIPSMVAWNIVTGGLHGSRIVRTLRTRKLVALTASEAQIRDWLFPGMSEFDFNILWSMGAEVTYSEAMLIEQGTVPTTVSVITDGEVSVARDGEIFKRLGVGLLVGEMSFVSGEPAHASVIADDVVVVRQWNQRQLASLDQVHPQSAKAFQSLMTRDLVRKVAG